MKIWKIAQDNSTNISDGIDGKKPDEFSYKTPYQERREHFDNSIDQIIQDFKSGKTINELANQYKYGERYIRELIKNKIGEKSYRAILNKNLLVYFKRQRKISTPEQFKIIAKMFREGIPLAEISDMFGASINNIRDRLIEEVGKEKYKKILEERREILRKKRPPFVITKEIGEKILGLFRQHKSISSIKLAIGLYNSQGVDDIGLDDIKEYIMFNISEEEYDYITAENENNIKLHKLRYNPSYLFGPTDAKKKKKDYFRIRNSLSEKILNGYYAMGETIEQIATKFDLDITMVAKYLDEAEKDPFISSMIENFKRQRSIANVKALSQSWYKIAKQEKIHLTPQERQQVKDRFGDNLECSFAKDKDGYYCHTHRARSKSYDSISKIPFSKVEFIGSTG